MIQKLRIVVLMIALALAGIVYFQVQWVKSSYRIWHEQFDTKVREALTSAVENKLQDKIFTLSKSYALSNAPSGTVVKIMAMDTFAAIENIMVNIDKTDLIFTEDFDQYKSYVKMMDSLTVVVDEQVHRVDDELDIHVSAKGMVRMSNPDSIERHVLKYSFNGNRANMLSEEWLDTLIEQVVETSVGVDASSYTHFKNSLEEELANSDIGLPFELGVYNADEEKYEYLYPQDSDTCRLNMGYKAPLLGNLRPSSFASLYFPDQQLYIQKKLLPVLIGSILLFLITAGSFVLMLQTILRQKRLSEIKNDFVNNMTHELKTPISTVSLALEALQDFDGLKDQQRTERYMNIARNENSRLGLLVNKILKMSTYERDDLRLHKEECDSSECIENVCKNFAVQLQQSNGVLTKKLEAENPVVEVDRVHFNNVVYNLLDNAVKYSGTDPRVTVSTYNENNYLVVEVADRGKGIAKQHQHKIFDKFYRVPSGDLHNVKGHGLGLSYVRKIMEAHRGTVQLESKPREGSRFKLYFPVMETTL